MLLWWWSFTSGHHGVQTCQYGLTCCDLSTFLTVQRIIVRSQARLWDEHWFETRGVDEHPSDPSARINTKLKPWANNLYKSFSQADDSLGMNHEPALKRNEPTWRFLSILLGHLWCYVTPASVLHQIFIYIYIFVHLKVIWRTFPLFKPWWFRRTWWVLGLPLVSVKLNAHFCFSIWKTAEFVFIPVTIRRN